MYVNCASIWSDAKALGLMCSIPGRSSFAKKLKFSWIKADGCFAFSGEFQRAMRAGVDGDLEQYAKWVLENITIPEPPTFCCEVFAEIRTLAEGPYINFVFRVKTPRELKAVSKNGYKLLNVGWVRADDRMACGKAMAWMNEHMPEIIPLVEHDAKWLCSNVSIKGQE